jgi:hypothetical protein
MSPSLSRAERRLHERLKELLPDDEELRAAIIVWTGSKPGAEGIGMMLAGLLGILLSRKNRSYFTVAVTDRGVVQFRNRRERHPARLVGRYELDELRSVTAKWGEVSIELAGERYWPELGGGELGRLQRLLRQGG